MDRLKPIDVLFESGVGRDIPLPPELGELYGLLRFPVSPAPPYVISNFVSSIDGVASLNANAEAVGAVISGFNEYDSCVMGLLRAVSDVVIVGAGTLAASPQHVWTPEYIYPPYGDSYAQLRKMEHTQEPILNVVVTEKGSLDLSVPLFQSGNVESLIVTVRKNVNRLYATGLPRWVHVVGVDTEDSLTIQAVLDAVMRIRPSALRILVEGGPHLIGSFLEENLLHELFLTISPQIAGRSHNEERMGIVEGVQFAPEHPAWASLVSVRKAASHLFLRYMFESAAKR